MTKFAKILSLVLALTMLCGAAFAEAPQLAAEAQTEAEKAQKWFFGKKKDDEPQDTVIQGFTM